MSAPQFVDVSKFQGTIDFSTYVAWAKQWDGISRIAMKATEGVGFTDPLFPVNRAKALAAGVDCVIYYHFSRPDLQNTASAEADYFYSVVGNVRASDTVMLDYEADSTLATADWACKWLARQEQNYKSKLPSIYASTAYIQQRLQDSRLARYALWLADWHFTPDARPTCPSPWRQYTWLQFTDKATGIPGISGIVDCNIFLGGTPVSGVPQGWYDNGSVLTAPNGITVQGDYRAYVLTHNWDPNNTPEQPVSSLSSLELSNPTLGPGTWQPFRQIALEQPQGKGVLQMYAGRELLATRTLLTTAIARLDHINALSKL